MSRWLDIHLNKLYFSKVPYCSDGTVQGSTPSGGYLPEYVDWRRLSQRVSQVGPDDWELHGSIGYRHTEANPECRFAWCQSLGASAMACDYDTADLLPWCGQADLPRATALRAAVFKVKIQVLCCLADALRKRDSQSLTERCLELVAKELSAEDAEYLFQLDVHFSGHEARTRGAEVAPLPLNAGGLSSLLELVGYVEKEMVIGTMCQTRDALGDAVVLDHLRRPRLITEFQRGNYPRLAAIPPSHPYLDLASVGMAGEIRKAVDRFAEQEPQEPSFWEFFRHRVEVSLADEFLRDVRIPVKGKDIARLEPLLIKTARDWQGDPKPPQPRPRATVVVPTPIGAKWEDVTIAFTSDEAVRISVRGGDSKMYTYMELGFADKRQGDIPLKLWDTFKAIANLSKMVERAANQSKSPRKPIKSRISAIRKLLKELFKLDGDPIPFVKKKWDDHDLTKTGYVPRFRLFDKSYSVEGDSNDPDAE